MNTDDIDKLDLSAEEQGALPNFIPPSAAKAPVAADRPVENDELVSPQVASEEAVAPEQVQPSAPKAPETPEAAADAAPLGVDQPAAPQAGADSGQERAIERTYAGVLVDHGSAPYKHDPQEKQNYFVTLNTPEGPETVWGIDLQRAMEENGAQPGEAIRMDFLGSESVEVQANVRDAQGNVIGTEPKQVMRNAWDVQVIDAAELDLLQGQAAWSSVADELRSSREASEPQASAQQQDAPQGAEAQAAQKQQEALSELDPNTLEALMAVANGTRSRASGLNPDEVLRVNEVLHSQPQQAMIAGAGPTRGQEQVRTGAEALLEGGATLVGGAASLAGSVMKGVGKGASALAGALRGRDSEADAQFGAAGIAQDKPLGIEGPDAQGAGVQVLPRLSEYRVSQVEKAAGNYEKAHQEFWAADKMPAIREQIEARAQETGLSVQDVMEKMKPNGEFADLHEKFNEAVSQSPDAQSSKKAMDKALDSWARQYGRAQEELLNPETEGSPHYEKLKGRLDGSNDKMQRTTSETPAFEGEDQSHFERLKEALQKIAERLKEMVKSFAEFVKGKASPKAEATGGEHAPSP